MLDINLIRTEPEKVKQALLKKMDSVDLSPIIELDAKRRYLITEADTLKAKRNAGSAQLPKLPKDQKAELLAEMKTVSGKIKELDAELASAENELQNLMAALPNMPADDVQPGGKESNEVLRSAGEKPDFSFKPLTHIELEEKLGLIDYARAAKLSGSGFWMYKDKSARLEWALVNFFIESHLANGFCFILPPHILGHECGFASGQFPKFGDEVFHVDVNGPKSHFLLPTAETALISLHRGEIIPEEELPKKYFAYTPCFRCEPGGYGAQERGTIRGYQFNKVELVQLAKPQDAQKSFDEMIACAEAVLQKLKVHYRVTKLAARDCTSAMAKTFDIEIWLPSINDYKEVSSVSTAGDYQARRADIKFKNSETGKNELVHTLNGSCLATSRLFPALLEQFQQADGSVIVPEVLREKVGTDILRSCN
jgi:seryl-tRNA synthetase